MSGAGGLKPGTREGGGGAVSDTPSRSTGVGHTGEAAGVGGGTLTDSNSGLFTCCGPCDWCHCSLG